MCLGDFSVLPPIFRFMKLILEQSKCVLENAINKRRSAALDVELFKIVYDVLRRHLYWFDNQSGDYRLKSLSTLPSADADVTFTTIGLGNDPNTWLRRFVLNILDETKRRMSRGFWAVNAEYASLIVDDLQNQFSKLINSMGTGLPRHALPFLPQLPYVGALHGGCGICKSVVCEGEMITNFKTTLPCEHSFHSECLNRWLQTSRLCPFCEANVWNLLVVGSESNFEVYRKLSISYCQRSLLSRQTIIWRFDDNNGHRA